MQLLSDAVHAGQYRPGSVQSAPLHVECADDCLPYCQLTPALVADVVYARLPREERPPVQVQPTLCLCSHSFEQAPLFSVVRHCRRRTGPLARSAGSSPWHITSPCEQATTCSSKHTQRPQLRSRRLRCGNSLAAVLPACQSPQSAAAMGTCIWACRCCVRCARAQPVQLLSATSGASAA